MLFTSPILALSALVAIATASPRICQTHASKTTNSSTIKCPIVLDGRVPANASLTSFDTANGLFNPDYVKGNNLSWSDILLFPTVATNSRFDSADAAQYKPIEVNINNASVYQAQYGFRRAGLLFANDSNTGSLGYTGVKTLHWSVQQDPQRALNLSHEYLNVWHESADYSADQIMFQAGSILAQPGLARDTFKVFDRNSSLLWSVAMDLEGGWQNFAVTLDVTANTIQIYYSTGTDPLQAVTDVIPTDLSGDGQFQIGMIKKPTGTSDVVNAGYQEAPFEEGQIYGGLFVEDSAGGCISL
ncbi:hypothetical protein BD289DRAFT_433121 [Coniella lustricola]|uniref:Glycoside hydrolase 131 catalytic N-terminal domain-containing protein n=1 Tax=Coniella lustricola TaxID=2025994 RepID=A0A2T3A8X7_9PEZI|nr:hypothetical protein BD289DRAFT_433121 [Coniella lustricola]